MRLVKLQVFTLAAAGGVLLLSLAACLQGAQRQADAVIPPPAPKAYGLFYVDEGASVKLAYGAPNSDDVGLMMECAKGSRAIDVSDMAKAGAVPVLVLTSQRRTAELAAQTSSGDGGALLVAHARSDLAPFQAFRRTGRIEVAYAGSKVDIVASSAEQAGVERFFAACERAP